MKKSKKNKPTKVLHKVGDKHFIEGVELVTKFVNNGTAWVCPTFDDDDETTMLLRHICYGCIDDQGKVKRL